MVNSIEKPTWSQDLSDRYLAGLSHAFLLHGNVEDYVGGVLGYSLKQYLYGSFKERDLTVYWNRASGFQFPTDEMKKRFIEVLGLTGRRSSGLAASMNNNQEVDPLALIDQHKPTSALSILSRLLHIEKHPNDSDHDEEPFRVAVILDYGDFLAPASDMSAADDRTILVTLDEWGRDTKIGNLNHIIVMIASDLHGINDRLRRSGARWEQIEIPYPSYEERKYFIESIIKDSEVNGDDGSRMVLAPHTSSGEIARLTTGLRYISIDDIFLRGGYRNVMISPELVKERKDEIVASEYQSILQIVDNTQGFASLGGLQEVVDDLLDTVVKPMHEGNFRIVPMGIIFMGPAGTGKTRLAQALAKEAGVTFVELQPSKIYSKWYGDTEQRLERALTAIAMMTPCIVFIDELDQAINRGEQGSSHEVSNHVFKRLMEFMSDTTLRGKVLWIGATNRPDLLDAALMRPGRFDKKIPILPPSEEGRAQIIAVLAQQTFGDGSNDDPFPSYEECRMLAKTMDGYTGAEIEGVIGKAIQLRTKNPRWTMLKAIQEAHDRIIPSTQNIEEMTKLALHHCNDLDLIPPHLRPLARVSKNTTTAAVEDQPQPRRRVRKG